MRYRTRAIAAGLLAGSLVALAACSPGDGTEPGDSSGFPEKDFTFIVQAAAGGASDLTSRALADQLEDILGRSFIVENRPGASGSTAMNYVGDATPDGYTMGFFPVEIALLDHLDFDLDPNRFTFLGQIMNQPLSFAVPANSPYESIEDLIEAAKTTELTVSTSGAGSVLEAAVLAINEAAGTRFVPVPFDGAAPAVTAAVGEQVDVVSAGVVETGRAANDGSLRLLVVFDGERDQRFPDAPTAREAGYDMVFGLWGVIGAPKDLPDDVKATLEAAIEEAVGAEGYISILEASGATPLHRSSEDATAWVFEQYELFGELFG